MNVSVVFILYSERSVNGDVRLRDGEAGRRRERERERAMLDLVGSVNRSARLALGAGKVVKSVAGTFPCHMVKGWFTNRGVTHGRYLGGGWDGVVP